MSDHEHRHLHLGTGNFWWHRHQHECDGIDFNALHHHAPVVHDALSEWSMRVDILANWRPEGNYDANLHDQGWKS